MRNIKKQDAKVAEAEPESQLEDSSDLLHQYQKGALPSNIIDLEDFDADAASDISTAQPQEKDREESSTFKEEMIETQQYVHSRIGLSSLS